MLKKQVITAKHVLFNLFLKDKTIKKESTFFFFFLESIKTNLQNSYLRID